MREVFARVKPLGEQTLVTVVYGNKSGAETNQSLNAFIADVHPSNMEGLQEVVTNHLTEHKARYERL